MSVSKIHRRNYRWNQFQSVQVIDGPNDGFEEIIKKMVTNGYMSVSLSIKETVFKIIYKTNKNSLKNNKNPNTNNNIKNST